MIIYKVGGIVRDSLMGLDSKDYDYVVIGATPDEMKSLGYIQVGRSFPVFLQKNTKAEYALARTEQKTGNKHYDFQLDFNPNITLHDDLSRRDITINAMAMDNSGNLIDYFDGLFHLQIGLIKHVSGSFSDDPLRVLRVARFSSNLAFAIDPSTYTIMSTLGQINALRNVSVERVAQEINKTNQYKLYRFFLILHKTDNLKSILPQLDKQLHHKNNRFSLKQIIAQSGLLGIYCYHARYIKTDELHLIFKNSKRASDYLLILQIYIIHDRLTKKLDIISKLIKLNIHRNYNSLLLICNIIITHHNALRCNKETVKNIINLIQNIMQTKLFLSNLSNADIHAAKIKQYKTIIYNTINK